VNDEPRFVEETIAIINLRDRGWHEEREESAVVEAEVVPVAVVEDNNSHHQTVLKV